MGGDCGGWRYFAGAMSLLRRGRYAEPENEAFDGLRYVSIEVARAPERREARVAMTRRKRAMKMKKRLEKRVGARVSVVLSRDTWRGLVMGLLILSCVQADLS